MINKKVQTLVMFLTGGIVYFFFEIFVRGYSHISMFLLGGICFGLVGKTGNKVLENGRPLVARMLAIMMLSALIITSLEYITGVIVNVYLGLNVWDYSHMSFNYQGQICALYSALWSLLGLPCVYFYGVINRFVLESHEDV